MTMNAHTEIVEERAIPWLPSQDYIRQIPAVLWAQRKVIGIAVALSLLIGLIALLLMEPRYTASAVVQFDFSGRADYARIIDLGERDATVAAPAIAIDASREVETFARLIMTDAIARRVVQRLGLDKDYENRSFISSWMDSRLPVPQSATDRATLQLLEGLTVTSDLRSYLLTVTYTAPHPVEAAELANAFLSEALRVQSITRLNNQFAAAQRSFKDLALTFGEQHPTMARAASNLAAAKQRLENQQQQIEAWSDADLSAAGNVVPAAVNTVPTYPKPRIIMTLSVVIGLLAGAALALLLDFMPALPSLIKSTLIPRVQTLREAKRKAMKQ
jgi:uncharacterized protein involved in exopolysaccharide biosynthesis